MNNISTISPPQLRAYSRSQLSLIRKTIAKDCNNEEFDLFIEICKHQGLDPFKKQIYAFVFKKIRKTKDDATGQWTEVTDRTLTPVTSIDGYRAKAARQRDYRPSDSEPDFEIDKDAIDPKRNPHGIVKCRVVVYQFGPDRQWYPIVGVARWEEMAPIVEGGDWVNNKFQGNGEFTLDPKKPNWRKMDFIMLAKCAEANALRKGWPEEFSGLYISEEIDRMSSDQSATEAAEQFEADERIKRIAGPSAIPMVLNFTDGIQLMPAGQVVDKV
ncbi:MAG: recombinase, partial [Micavibrio sp.]|nr:recombinase [Micavibrio sp.]